MTRKNKAFMRAGITYVDGEVWPSNDIRVFLDNELQKMCIYADAEVGMIVRYMTKPTGDGSWTADVFERSDGRFHVAQEVVYGEVRIEVGIHDPE